ncbi:MAG: hypothetical protein JJD98_02630 [Polaromonas sp.]|nr:hypothetical protein [Polaromonas sp.]
MDHHTTINGGLPCIARVTHYSPGCAAKINADPYDCWESEPAEIEFKLLTTRGKPAPWLEKLMSTEDRERIETELLEEV